MGVNILSIHEGIGPPFCHPNQKNEIMLNIPCLLFSSLLCFTLTTTFRVSGSQDLKLQKDWAETESNSNKQNATNKQCDSRIRMQTAVSFEDVIHCMIISMLIPMWIISKWSQVVSWLTFYMVFLLVRWFLLIDQINWQKNLCFFEKWRNCRGYRKIMVMADEHDAENQETRMQQKNPPCHLLQTPPLLVSNIKVNPGVSGQHLQMFQSILPHCPHHHCEHH